MLTIFGGRVADLELLLTEERLPDGWESRVRKRLGLTFASFNAIVFKVASGINEKKYKDQLAAAAAAAETQVEPAAAPPVEDAGAAV